MDNLYFGLTKPELIEKVAAGDSGAQVELDRRAAKKAAKREVVVPQAQPMTAAERSVLPLINQGMEMLINLRDNADSTGAMPAFVAELTEIIEHFNGTLAGLPIE